MEKFIKSIVQNLEENGFPAKKVSLPTEKMYEIADKKGLSFNKILEKLNCDFNVEAKVETEKIIFSKAVCNTSPESPEQIDPQEMMKKAQEMMANMDPAELQKMKDMFTDMSDSEKDDLMQKGKDMGIL